MNTRLFNNNKYPGHILKIEGKNYCENYHCRLNPQGKPEYNFTSLDTLIERLWVNELRPGFEVMGNPSDMFTDFENITQVWMWRSLVYDLVLRSGGKGPVRLLHLSWKQTWAH